MIQMNKSLMLGLIGVVIILFAVAAILDIHSEQAEAGELEEDSVTWAPACNIAGGCELENGETGNTTGT